MPEPPKKKYRSGTSETLTNLGRNMASYFLHVKNTGIVPSEYKPTKAKDKTTQYYTWPNLRNDVKSDLMSQTYIDNINGQQASFSKQNPKYLPSYVNEANFDQLYNYYTNSPKSSRVSGSSINLGEYSVTPGQDERGRYMGVYDKYDWNLLEGLGFKGKSWETYDRIYEDEWDKIPTKKMEDGGKITEGDPTDPPKKKLTAKEIKSKYQGNPYVAGREQWGEYFDTKTLPFSGTKLKDAIYQSAKTTGIEPGLLYSSAMEEGLREGIDKPDMVSQAYLNAIGEGRRESSGKPQFDPNQYPIDGFRTYGLDTFGDQYANLTQKGYLPKEFARRFKIYKAINELGQPVNTAAFVNETDALTAKAAMLKNLRENLKSYSTNKNIKLSPRQEEFFNLVGYNAGEGNMRKMIESYSQKGYLKDDNFLIDPNFNPASYGQPFKYAQRRLVNENIMKEQGYFSDFAPPSTSNDNPQSFKNGGTMSFKTNANKKNYVTKYAAFGDTLQPVQYNNPYRVNNQLENPIPYQPYQPQYNKSQDIQQGLNNISKYFTNESPNMVPNNASMQGPSFDQPEFLLNAKTNRVSQSNYQPTGQPPSEKNGGKFKMPNMRFNTAAPIMAIAGLVNSVTQEQESAEEYAKQARRNSMVQGYNPHPYGNGSQILFANGGELKPYGTKKAFKSKK